jgi:ABC-type multidrug transport system permease subunit
MEADSDCSATLGWWFRWISYISPMKYGFVALIKNEFSGLLLTCNPSVDNGCPPSGTYPGEQIITVSILTVNVRAALMQLM